MLTRPTMLVDSAAVGAESTSMVGRVSISPVDQDDAARIRAVSDALEARFTSVPGRRFPDRRVISVRPRPGDPSRFDATIYDYTVERGFDLVLDAEGRELGRNPLPSQPEVSLSEQ